MRKLILLAALVLPAAAHSQWPRTVEARLTRQYKDCMASSAAARGQTLAMTDCQVAEIVRHDGRLNQAYVMVRKRLSPQRRAVLRQSQRDWIARRDRVCKVAARRYQGGSAAGLEHRSCFLRETISRTAWLESYR